MRPGHGHKFVPPPPRKSSSRSLRTILRTHTIQIVEWALLGGALAGYVVLVLLIPKIFAGPVGLTPEGQADYESSVRNSLIQALGGLALLVGAGYTVRTYRLSNDRNTTERLATAVEQLGSPDLHVRIGGLISLERIANDSKRDYRSVMSLLLTYVRSRRRPIQAVGATSTPRQLPPVEPDVQVALEIFGRRRHRELEADLLRLGSLDLRGANLARLDLSLTDFTYTQLDGGRLTECRLEFCYLNHSKLSAASFTRASLRGSPMPDVTAVGTYFKGADLRECNLVDGDFTRADFSATWDEGRLITRAARLEGARLRGATLHAAGLRGVDLSSASGLTTDQLRGTEINDQTILPPDILRTSL